MIDVVRAFFLILLCHFKFGICLSPFVAVDVV